jgi:hypothetical protein
VEKEKKMKIPSRGESNWNEKRAALYLWSIRRQDDLSINLQTFMWSAIGTILLLSLLLPIDLETALQIIFFGGLTVCGLLWVFIERRRSWLLTIQDPALKESAHREMIDYLERKVGVHPRFGQVSRDDSACTVC